jgi:ADP-ribose pyrophosphatase YjhB (NUDIX family)
MRGRGAHRGVLLLGAVVVLAFVLASCGGGDDSSGETDTAAVEREAEQEADIETLNTILGRQLSVIDVYDRTLPQLSGGALTLATSFRQQEQEHVDGVLQQLRALDGVEEAEAEEIESDRLKTEAQHLRFLYEVESETIEDELGAIARLSSSGSRSLLAATVANQAQHLVLLRRALGAIPLEWVPSPFETGATPAP